MTHRPRTAVIGSGVAGLTAAHVLQRGADVTLYEADARLGGHADTHDVPVDGGPLLDIDTGFIVHNHRTYPTLLKLFAELGVATQESDMSMSISCSGCGLEYAGGRGLSGLLPSVRALRTPRYLRLLTQVRRFHRLAHDMLATSEDDRTLAQFLRDNRFTPYFEQHFVTPLVSAVWSTAPSQAGDYPARFLFSFLDNHGMLQVTGSPTWYTVVGGSARYVEKVAKGLTAVQTATPVRSVRRVADGVEIRTDDDVAGHFGNAVIATHPHQALAMLDTPTPAERGLLGAIDYTVNPALLHTDDSVLPAARRAQASWNYVMDTCAAVPSTVQVSYNMNRLQRLDELGARHTYVVTLNGEHAVDPVTVIDRMTYEHPVYTTDSVAARGRLGELNDGVLAYAGAYHGWGFHEDGARSGVDAARSLGGSW
ncbi:MAG: NAD(P)/FAD-dependent oxidoreductase [Jatrophihabitantaceae bacterium]